MSTRHPGRFAAVIATAIWLAVSLGFAGPPGRPKLRRFEIPMSGRVFLPPVGVSTTLPSPPTFVVFQFHDAPTPAVRKVLDEDGILILDRLHRTAFFARVSPGVDIETVVDQPVIRDATRAVFVIPPRLKIAPPFLRRNPPPNVQAVGGGFRAIAIFQPTTPARVAATAIRNASITGEPYDPPRVWSVRATREELIALARVPELRWIRPPPAGYVPLGDVLRAASGADALQAPTAAGSPGPLDGSGVEIAVFDCPTTTRFAEHEVSACSATPSEPSGETFTVHSDLLEIDEAGNLTEIWRSRIAEADECRSCDGDEGFSRHGDWVAGLIGGSGFRSDLAENECGISLGTALQYRGVAPRVVMNTYPPRPDAGETNLCRSAKQYPVSNHSYLTDALLYGDYSRLLDKTALGLFQSGCPDDYDDADEETGRHGPDPQVVVVAAGNSGNKSDRRFECDPSCEVVCEPCNFVPGCLGECGNARGFFSVFAPSKNAIVVGAVDAGQVPAADGGDGTAWIEPVDSRAHISSIGPTPDGRIKPDLMAPGCRPSVSGGSPIVLRTASDGYGGDTECGTSFAAAVASGVVVLLAQRWEEIRETTAEEPDAPDRQRLWPSTYKALLVLGALDMQVEPRDCVESDWDCVPDTVHQREDGVYVGPTLAYGPGPDYATGHGLLRATLSEQALRERRFEEAALTGLDEVWTRSLGGAPTAAKTLRVVLAWDDPPFEGALASPSLQNDLELRVRVRLTDGTKQEFGPWALPPVDWNPQSSVVTDWIETGQECPEGYTGNEILDSELLGTGITQLPSAIRCYRTDNSWRDVATDVSLVDVDDAGVRTPLWNPFREEGLFDVTGTMLYSEATALELSNMCRDDRNNVEVVDIEFPVGLQGRAKVEVFAEELTSAGGQDFSVTWGWDLEAGRDLGPLVSPGGVSRTDVRDP